MKHACVLTHTQTHTLISTILVLEKHKCFFPSFFEICEDLTPDSPVKGMEIIRIDSRKNGILPSSLPKPVQLDGCNRRERAESRGRHGDF